MRIRKRCFIEKGQAYQTSNVLECPNRVVFITVVLVNLFLIGRWLLYNIVLVSAIHQHESAIGILLSPPSTTSLPLSPHLTPVVVTPWGLRSLSHAGNSLWLAVLCMVMHTFPCCLCPTFSSPCCVHNSFSMSASPLLPWKICSSIPSFWIPYICVNIWYLFFQLTSVFFFFLVLRDYHNSKLKGGIYHTLNKEVNS